MKFHDNGIIDGFWNTANMSHLHMINHPRTVHLNSMKSWSGRPPVSH